VALNLIGSHYPVAIIGGGQAGLAMSYCLRQRAIDHVVIEKHKVGYEWRERRWRTFCLVTPNWQCRLPGFPYAGPDPDGFMERDEIVRYLEDYAASFGPPLAEGAEVTRLDQDAGHAFRISGESCDLTADHVVVATGPYHHPAIPRMAERLPADVRQLHSSEYRGPARLPDGEVLVVGTGQSGCQIAEDLQLEGRTVHLAVGSAPRVARFYRGRDVVAWLNEMGYYDKPIDQFADADAVRLRVNHYVSGRGGGHDIDLRAFARAGMRLYGRLTGVDGPSARFATDLRANLDHADAVSESIKDAIDEYIEASGANAPPEARYSPVWEPSVEPAGLDLRPARIGTVIWATGFRQDYRWIRLPAFDGRGYPVHRRGVTTRPGLYFIGLPWLHTWGSGRFSGIARDAAYLAGHIASALIGAVPAGAVPAGPVPAAGNGGRSAYWVHPELLGT
jgi:putative flavoprotein involved in K+ transport